MNKRYRNYLNSRISDEQQEDWLVSALAYAEIFAPPWIGLSLASRYLEWEFAGLVAFFLGCLVSAIFGCCMSLHAEKKLNVKSNSANTDFFRILTSVTFVNIVTFLFLAAALSGLTVLGLLTIKFVFPLL